MSSLETRASLRRLSEVLEDPAPINRGHAHYVRRLITGTAHTEAPWSGSGATEQRAAIAPDDAAEDPAL